MIIAILLITIFLGIGGYTLATAYADHTAMTIRLAEIEAAHNEAMAPWVVLVILIIAVAVVLVFYFRRPAPTVNDNRTVILLGQSKREFYKRLSDETFTMARMETRNRLASHPLRSLDNP